MLQQWEQCPNQKQALTIAFDQLELLQQPLSLQEKWIRRRWLLWKNNNNYKAMNPWSSIRRFPYSKMNNKKDNNNDDYYHEQQQQQQQHQQDNEHCTLSVVELVRLIHLAAQDRHICALFGNFGNANTNQNTTRGSIGWSDWEEIRNALIVFSQSHRRHWEPPPSEYDNHKDNNNQNNNNNQASNMSISSSSPRMDRKSMICYAQNFGTALSSGNPAYYLASVFHRIHLQTHGELELLGMMQQSWFIKPFLERYGIQFHVIKEGEYKTTPNTWTEKTFTKAHKENAFNLVHELNTGLCLDMTQARSKALLTSWLTKSQRMASPRNNRNGGGSPEYDCPTNNNKNGKNGLMRIPTSSSSSSSSSSSTNSNLQKNKTILVGGGGDIVHGGGGGTGTGCNDTYYDNLLSQTKILEFWHGIHTFGTFPAYKAWKIGLVDCLPKRNPMFDLIAYNYAKEQGQDQWADYIQSQYEPHETDFNSCTKPTTCISLLDYQIQQETIQTIQQKREQYLVLWQSSWNRFLQLTTGGGGGDKNNKKKDSMGIWIPSILLPAGTMTTKPPKPPQQQQARERIVCLDVIGGIDDAKARSVVSKLRAIKVALDQDLKKKKQQQQEQTTHTVSDQNHCNKNNNTTNIKCLLLRIVSPGGQIVACEQIAQELQALSIPVVVSMGSVAASGGYYIAAQANRIFGLNKTITGSIGVYGVRADLTQWAKLNGIRVEHVSAIFTTTSSSIKDGNNGTPLAAMYSIFCPMTPTMKQNMALSVERSYDLFRQVVINGRQLYPNQLDELAQGKVWTGRQAKEIGLVDEIGGYERALAYAKRTYCNNQSDDQIDVGRFIPRQQQRRNNNNNNLLAAWTEWFWCQTGFQNYYTGQTGWWEWQSDKDSTGMTTTTLLLDRWFCRDCEEDDDDDLLGVVFMDDSTTTTTPSSVVTLLADWVNRGMLSSSSTGMGTTTTTAPPSLSGILWTADETLALQVLLQEQYRCHHHHHHDCNNRPKYPQRK